MRPVPSTAVNFIKSREGCVLRVYDDKQPRLILSSTTAILGVLTAGYGHTGHDLYVGLTVTQDMADGWLAEDMIKLAAVPLCAKIGEDIANELTENQYSALLSFVYNLGTGNTDKPEWTIWKRLRARQYDQVPLEMMKFVNWAGQKSEGLVARRAAEVRLWSTEEPGSENSQPPSSVTRREATPPTPADATPMSKSGAIIASAASAAAAIPVAISAASTALQPYADKTPMITHWIALLSMAGAVAAAVAAVLMVMKKREIMN